MTRRTEPDVRDVLVELRCRLDLGHFAPHVAQLLERAFEQHADGHPDGLLALLRAARSLRVTGMEAARYQQVITAVHRTREALRMMASQRA